MSIDLRIRRYSTVFYVVFLVLGGCGRSDLPKRYPVEGQVLLAQTPLAEAIVTFHPKDPNAPALPKPIGQTGADGRFRLTTIEREDGAVPGAYTITVELRAPIQIGEEIVRNGPNRLPPRYAQPDQSGLRYLVVPGPNRVDALIVAER